MLDHQTDLQADFRVFYRLTPAEAAALAGPEYLALAYRVSAYQGVMAARIAAYEETQRRRNGGAERTERPITDPALADLVEYTQAG